MNLIRPLLQKKRSINVLAQEGNVACGDARGGEVLGPTCNYTSHLFNFAVGFFRAQPKLSGFAQGVVDGGVGHERAHAHLLITQRLPSGQYIKSRCEFISTVVVHQQHVIFFVIIGVVDQDVEDHAAKEFAHLFETQVMGRFTSTAQELCQFGVPHALARGPERHVGREGVAARFSFAIKAFDRQRMTAPQFDGLGRRHLDARLRRRVREDIRALQRRLGLSVVYVTHDQQEALAVSDLVVVMRAGRIAQMGTPAELYDSPADAFVADFMGEANVLEGTVLAAVGGPGRIRLAGTELPAELPAHAPGPAKLAIRPEAISLVPAETDGALPGIVRHAAFLGQTREYEVETASGVLFVVSPAGAAAFAPGDRVGCRLSRVIPLGGEG